MDSLYWRDTYRIYRWIWKIKLWVSWNSLDYQVIVVSDAKNDVKSREQFVNLRKRNSSDWRCICVFIKIHIKLHDLLHAKSWYYDVSRDSLHLVSSCCFCCELCVGALCAKAEGHATSGQWWGMQGPAGVAFHTTTQQNWSESIDHQECLPARKSNLLTPLGMCLGWIS